MTADDTCPGARLTVRGWTHVVTHRKTERATGTVTVTLVPEPKTPARPR